MGCAGSKHQQGAKMSGPSALNESKEQGKDSNTVASLSQPQEEEEDRAAPNDKDNPTPGKRSSLKREKQADEAAPSGTPGDTQEDGEQKRVSFAETATVFNPIIQPHEYSESSEGGSSHELHLHNSSAPDEQSAAASFSSASEDNAVFDAQEHEQNGSAAALTPAGAARAHPLPQLEALRGSSILVELQGHSRSYFDRIEYDAAAGGAAVKSATEPPGDTVTCVQDVYLIPSPTGGDVGLGGAFSYGAGGAKGAVVEEQGHDGFDKHDAVTVGGPDDEELQGHDEGPRNSLPENAVETKMATRASMSTSGAAFAGEDEDEESNPAEVTSRTESKEGDPARTISTTSTLSTEGSSS